LTNSNPENKNQYNPTTISEVVSELKYQTMPRLFFLFFAILAISCIEGDGLVDSPPENALIYVPVYANPDSVLKVSVSPAKQISNPAKIFTYNNFLIVNIKYEGFHVIDNSNPAVPLPLFFVDVPGNQDVSIKDGVIFADNYNDVVAFRITESGEVEIVKRLSNVMNNQEYPPFRDVYFECVDTSKGIVVDWVESNIPNPQCYR
jgi:hypothetical protein